MDQANLVQAPFRDILYWELIEDGKGEATVDTETKWVVAPRDSQFTSVVGSSPGTRLTQWYFSYGIHNRQGERDNWTKQKWLAWIASRHKTRSLKPRDITCSFLVRSACFLPTTTTAYLLSTCRFSTAGITYYMEQAKFRKFIPKTVDAPQWLLRDIDAWFWHPSQNPTSRQFVFFLPFFPSFIN